MSRTQGHVGLLYNRSQKYNSYESDSYGDGALLSFGVVVSVLNTQ